MTTEKLTPITRIALLIGGVLLLAVLYVPIWGISLDAPQYPEGLSMYIYANKLGGNVDIINGLNHYIGMKTLHNEDFIEFKIIPYFIVFFSGLFILTAILANRKLLITLLALFVSFGIIAMVDFWRWEYDYGHNLNPDAAIKVPGMSYQPPLIGYKQLLNFGAYSMPDIGGIIFILVGLLLVVLIVVELRIQKKRKSLNNVAKNTAFLLVLISFSACETGPRPINMTRDNCAHCKMNITDNRFGAELVTKKGKMFIFDDAVCMIAFIKSKEVKKNDIKNHYLVDYTGTHQLINADDAFIVKSETIKGPMNGHLVAFAKEDDMKHFLEKNTGTLHKWHTITE
ncbi:MAG: nitrous oxide reductase accessory protein NosL [Sediminibacterium sp.]|jgi:copper chaperone NosL|nr:nitrous oxide reductase accessory protein NosL [Sediminibacterium sp.]